MARLLVPFVLGLCVGFFVAKALFSQLRSEPSDWESKYRELHDRYRDLTRTLKQPSDNLPPEYARLRQGVSDIRDRVQSTGGLSAAEAHGLVAEVDRLLEATRLRPESTT